MDWCYTMKPMRCFTYIILLPIISLIASCGSMEHKDGVTPGSVVEQALHQTAKEAMKTQAELSKLPKQDEMDYLLMPPLPSTPDDVELRFDISANSVPARDFFMSLIKETDINIIIHPDVKGRISFRLKSVTIDEVLQAVRDTYGYQYERTPYGFRILPFALQTKIFPVSYLNVNRTGSSSMSVSSGQITSAATSSSSSEDSGSEGGAASTVNSAQIETETKADFWSDLSVALQTIVGNGNGRKVIVNPQAGIVVVRALPNEIKEVGDFLYSSIHSLQKQVIIEAKVVEVTLREDFQAGIDWNTVARDAVGTATTGINNIVGSVDSNNLANTESAGGIFSLNLNFRDFQGLLQLLETQGKVQVLSSPRISTVNNQKAVIKVGTDEFYVTEVSNTSTSTGTTTTNIPELTLTPFFSGIALDVTPQIGKNNNITLHVHPSVTEVSEQTKQINIGDDDYSLPLAVSSIRETDSIVRAKNGQIVVIGGLLQSRRENIDSKVPFFSKIPGIGKLFEQKRDSNIKSELVILLRPVVVDHNNWAETLRNHTENFGNLKNRWPNSQGY